MCPKPVQRNGTKHLGGHITTFNCKTLLEQPEENPFLERFYQDQRTGALPAQLYFLFQRARKIQEIRQSDMFQKVQVSDFLIFDAEDPRR